MNNNEAKNYAIELKYAPRKCEYFCLGDCCLPDTNRSCGTDKDNCEYYNLYTQLLRLKAENEQLTQKLENLTKENKELSEDFQATFKEMGERGKKLEKAVDALIAISKAHSETVPRIMKYAQQVVKELEE